jgi:hypothetical protein
VVVANLDVGASNGQPAELSEDQLDLIKRTISGPAHAALGQDAYYWSIRRLAALEDYFRDYVRAERLAARQPMPEHEFWWQRIINPSDRSQAIAEALSLWHDEDHPGFPAPTAELLEAAILAAAEAWPKAVEAELEQRIVQGWEAARRRLAAREALAKRTSKVPQQKRRKRPGPTPYDIETHLDAMQQLLTQKDRRKQSRSVTAAAVKVVGDGSGVEGVGDVPAKVRRLHDAYRASGRPQPP